MYVGNSSIITVKELGLEKNQWFHLAIYYTPQPITFECLLLLHDALSENNAWKAILMEFKKFSEDHHPKLYSESHELVWQRIQAAAMAFRGKNYKETAAIAYHWLYVRNMDAIIYPSIRDDEHCNFALNTSFVDKNLTLYKVHACRWNGEKIELHHTGHLESGFVIWNKTSREDFEQFENAYKDLQV